MCNRQKTKLFWWSKTDLTASEELSLPFEEAVKYMDNLYNSIDGYKKIKTFKENERRQVKIWFCSFEF